MGLAGFVLFQNSNAAIESPVAYKPREGLCALNPPRVWISGTKAVLGLREALNGILWCQRVFA